MTGSDPMTSKFAYLPDLDSGLFDRPKSGENKGYVQTWFAKGEDTPQEYWDSREPVHNGWFRYRKFTPFALVDRPQDLKWPPGVEIFNMQIAWEESPAHIKI